MLGSSMADGAKRKSRLMINVGQQYAGNIINADGNSTVFLNEDPKRDLDRLRQQLTADSPGQEVC
jgi:hypothetical protein